MAGQPAIILPVATPPDGTEIIEVSQQGNLRSMTLAQIANLTPTALILPIADPHVAGALWNNAGTVAISAG